MNLQLCQTIRHLRKERNLTQEQLAEALGVTAAAVYKWESGKSLPEIPVLMDLATFLEVSVDALLGHSWQTSSADKAVRRLQQFRRERDLEGGMAYARQVLQKYPNHFSVVLESAEIYFLTMDYENPNKARKALELYHRALELLDQNRDPAIGAPTIQSRIASCFCFLGKPDEAIRLLKAHNMAGINDARIGLLLSQQDEQAEEALTFLSQALGDCYGSLYNIVVGYANAYHATGRLQKACDLVLWLYELGQGLREPGTICWMDRSHVRLFTILAELYLLQGKESEAEHWLRQARETALAFDADPQYATDRGLRYYHGSHTSVSYDDMGETAMAMIEAFLQDPAAGANLRPLWQQIQENP